MYAGADWSVVLLICHDHLDLTTRSIEGHRFGDALLDELAGVCAEIAPDHEPWFGGFRVEIFQTVWVGKLEITPEDLIDPRARALLLSTLSAGGGEKGTRYVHAGGLTLKLTTRTPKADLQELGLQLSNDEFKLEPRAGRLSSEHAWFSTGPLRSEDHIRLLGEIERAYRSE